jgi:hypothetical protein
MVPRPTAPENRRLRTNTMIRRLAITMAASSATAATWWDHRMAAMAMRMITASTAITAASVPNKMANPDLARCEKFGMFIPPGRLDRSSSAPAGYSTPEGADVRACQGL